MLVVASKISAIQDKSRQESGNQKFRGGDWREVSFFRDKTLAECLKAASLLDTASEWV